MIGPFDVKPFSLADPIGVLRDVVNEAAGPRPGSLLQALGRAVRNRCPSCGSTRLFPKFLKPMLVCPACRQNWSAQRADDFPAYVAILLTGHIIVPAVIIVEQFSDPPMWVHLVLWLPLARSSPSNGGSACTGSSRDLPRSASRRPTRTALINLSPFGGGPSSPDLRGFE